MSATTYTAITMDGQEHTVPDMFTLRQWYFARRLRPDSFVLSPETGEWKLLKSVFDLAQWEAEERKVKGLGPTDSVYKPATSTQRLSALPETRSQTPYQYDRDNERGLRAAGVLMIINAAVSLMSLVLLALQHPSSPQVSSVWGFNILFDVIVGVKVLRSDNATRWKTIALIRVGLGGLLALALMIAGPNAFIRILGLLELLFASSCFSLLLGEASRARITVGVLAFAVSICSLIAVIALNELTGNVQARREIYQNALRTRSFSDVPSGSRIELPEGWVMLPANNPIVPEPRANMIAAHPDSESYAVLVVVGNIWGPSPDAALSGVIAEKRKQDPSLVEVERVNSQFGRLDGRKAIMTWQYKGKEIKGSVSVARNGAYYIVLHEWCLAEGYAKSRPQFEALENAAVVGEPQVDPTARFRPEY